MAEGEAQPGQDMLGSTYTHGLRYTSPATVEISGNVHDPARNLVDWVRLNVPAVAAGSFEIDVDSCSPWEDHCASASLVLRLLNENGQQAKYSCWVRSGRIDVSFASSERMTGTFSGTGECLDRDDTTGTSPPITISNGAFDVRLRAGVRG